MHQVTWIQGLVHPQESAFVEQAAATARCLFQLCPLLSQNRKNSSVGQQSVHLQALCHLEETEISCSAYAAPHPGGGPG